MCLALYKPAGVTIDESALETGFENNDDGAGFTLRKENGELRTYKGFFTFNQFIKYWRNVKNCEAMVHFRWMTSGKRNKDNCHPFRFGPKKSWAMIHNGVLHTRNTDVMSDTACFAQDVLHELAIRDMIKYNDVIEQLEEEIGVGNKMVIMPPEQDNPIILNEKKGFWENDVWWSNDSFKKTLFRYGGVYTASEYSGTSGNWWDVSDDEYHQWSKESVTTSSATTTTDDLVQPDDSDADKYLEYLERKWQQGLHSFSDKEGSK